MPEVSLSLPGEASTVPAARQFVASTLESWGHAEAGWAAAQIVSELAGNCALHARTDYCIRLVQGDGEVRLEVQDLSAARIRLRRYGEEATTGRGLRLVEHLAERWGVDTDETGKTIWVTLRLAEGDSGTYGEFDADEELGVDQLLAAYDDEDVVTAMVTAA